MAPKHPPIPPELFDMAAAIMRAIAHPLRLRILEVLERLGEASVSRLCAETGGSQPSVSQQLSRMRLEGVLGARREGSSVIYRVERPEVLGVLSCVRKMECR